MVPIMLTSVSRFLHVRVKSVLCRGTVLHYYQFRCVARFGLSRAECALGESLLGLCAVPVFFVGIRSIVVKGCELQLSRPRNFMSLFGVVRTFVLMSICALGRRTCVPSAHQRNQDGLLNTRQETAGLPRYAIEIWNMYITSILPVHALRRSDIPEYTWSTHEEYSAAGYSNDAV